MLVSKKILNSWKLLLEHGDYQEIEKISGIQRQVLSRAVKNGRMDKQTQNALSDYFEGKRLKNNSKKKL